MAGKIFAVIPAAGMGTRLGAGIPKAFFELGGVTLLRRAYESLVAAGVDRVIIAASPDMHERARLECPDAVIVAGGKERADSVLCGLDAIADQLGHEAGADDVVLVHDAARALTPVEMIQRLMVVPDGVDCVVPALPVSDTIKQVDEQMRVVGTPARAALRAVQTPQACRLVTLLKANEAFQRDESGDFCPTDDASLIEWFGGTVVVAPGDERALKITHPIDVVIAEHYLA
nr:2-C-methyl-D-erythritol 4-phosphate cytidylyltransferase [Corynebacterium aquilae]